MSDSAWYPAWRTDAYDQLLGKQAALKREFNLGAWARYDYDLEEGRIRWSDSTDVRVEGDVQVVGTAGPDDWLWGWANDSFPSQVLHTVLSVRAYGHEHAIDELTQPLQQHETPGFFGWQMSAIAMRLGGGECVYRAPKESDLFMVVSNIRWARAN